ncbi:MAG: DNA primase [Fibrobacterota bacterium]
MNSPGNDDIKEEVRRGVDLVSFVERYVSLRRTGTSYKGLCPFHNENSPSFVVSPDRDMYHCFGCGAGGDLFAFIMEIEGCSFPEALEMAAEEAGIDPSRLRNSFQDRTGASKNRHDGVPKPVLIKANTYAARFFYSCLRRSVGAVAFFKERGILPETVRDFQLGAAPEGWDNLSRRARKDGYTAEILTAAGLAVRSSRTTNSIYDRFRNRVIFPIFDIAGRPVAFGGRTLHGDDQGPKYLNSPESAVYRKNRVLYGLNFSRPHIQQEKSMVLVEGYMDVISLWQAGVRNCAATCGTALTVEQGRIIKRFCNRLYLVFDGDAAGQNAARKAVEVLFPLELDLRIVILDSGDDPDSIIQQKGAQAFRDTLEKAREAVAFYLSFLRNSLDMTTPQGKARAAESLARLIGSVQNEIIQNSYIRDCAGELRVDESVFKSMVKGKASPSRPAHGTSTQGAPRDLGEQFIATEGGSFLHFLAQNPDYLDRYRERLHENLFTDSTHKRLFSIILKYRNNLNKHLGEIEDEQLRRLISFLLLRKSTVDSPREWVEYKIERMETTLCEREKSIIVAEIARTRDSGTRKKLLLQLADITGKHQKNKE